MYRLLNFVFLLVVLSFLTCAKKNSEYIYVVDSSGSMSEGDNTLQKVKKKLPDLLETANTGDTVTIITFDESVKVVDSRKIKSEQDVIELIDRVNSIEALGPYTDYETMLGDLMKRIDKTDSENRIIIVLSDGKDDPRPGTRKDRVSLEEYKSEKEGAFQESYIYYVSLGKIKSRKLEEGLKNLSDKVKTIESTGDAAGSDGDSTGLSTVKQDILRHSYIESGLRYSAIGVAVILIVFAAVYLINRLQNRYVLKGDLTYYEENAPYQKNMYHLKKVRAGTMSIGSAYGSNLKIKNPAFSSPFYLRASKKGGVRCMIPYGKNLEMMNFLEQKQKGIIQNGDKFKIANYIFEYSDEAQEREYS